MSRPTRWVSRCAGRRRGRPAASRSCDGRGLTVQRAAAEHRPGRGRRDQRACGRARRRTPTATAAPPTSSADVGAHRGPRRRRTSAARAPPPTRPKPGHRVPARPGRRASGRRRTRAARPSARLTGGPDEGPGHRRRPVRQVGARRVAARRRAPTSRTSRPARRSTRTPTRTGPRGSPRTGRVGRRPGAPSRPATSPRRSPSATDAVLVDCLGTWLDRGRRRRESAGTLPADEVARAGRGAARRGRRRAGGADGDRGAGDQRGRARGGAGAPVGPAVPRPARRRSTSGSPPPATRCTSSWPDGCCASRPAAQPTPAAAWPARARSPRRTRRR